MSTAEAADGAALLFAGSDESAKAALAAYITSSLSTSYFILKVLSVNSAVGESCLLYDS